MESKLDDSKDEEKSEAKGSKEDESIVERVTKYFFSDPSFANTLERWVDDKAEHIDVDGATDEYQLKYTELYNEFKGIYEGLLEDYIESQGYTVKSFYDELRRAAERDASETLLAEIILATSDFDIFMGMMRDYRHQQLQSQRQHK